MTACCIAKVNDAVIAFNRSKTWDEFLVKIDLIGMSLNDIENKYCEIMNIVDNPVILKMMKVLKDDGNEFSLKKIFMKHLTSSSNKCSEIRVAIPANVEYDMTMHDVKIYFDDNRYVSFNLDVCLEINSMHEIDIYAEMAETMLFELSMENSRR